ncbi:DUF4365 domain-containing protein, partial [Candidatus Woesearchaeota archaeon]|nr:DUF4365 domain-containing protein [Candidatus Woesearchaeota archaeon]
MWPATTDPDPNYKSEIGSLWTDTKYWLRHCLPVIIILYDPELGNLYWQSIEHETAISTGKKWKIRIPKSNIITNDTFTDFFALTQPSPYIQRYNKLLLDRNWISLLTNDEVVYVEFEDWINKSLPRFQIRIGCTTNNDIAEETWPTMYGPGVSIEEAIDYAIPWADYETDPIAHEAFMESKWYGEAVLRYDKEYDQPISSIP